MWTDEAIHERMTKGWGGGLPRGTPCGAGSTLERTADVRARLPELVQEYGIRSVCDAGAGDLHWIEHVPWTVEYRAFDLVPRHPRVAEIDITREWLPVCDLILCRMVLVHLDPERVQRALALFRQSGKYLLATQHRGENRFHPNKDYQEWNLAAEPFGLGEPLESIPDARTDCTLSLWRLQ